MRTLLLTALLSFCLCLAHAQVNQPSSAIVHQRVTSDWSSLPREARSSILTALEKEEGYKGSWVQQATLHASPSPDSGKGLAYIFVRAKNGWKNMKQTARLSTSDGGDCAPSGCAFGYSVAISGDAIMIGAPTATFNGTILAGAVYVFSKPETGWKTTYK